MVAWTIYTGKPHRNQRRVLLKSGSGESQQEPLNEVLANMICDRLDIKNYVKYQCGYQEDQSSFILSTLQGMLSGDGSWYNRKSGRYVDSGFYHL